MMAVVWLSFAFFLLVPMCILIGYVKKDSELQRKKKEKEIELLQAQIDSVKEEKGT